MNQSEEVGRILARVKKLLRLAADNAASEGERDNALRMAHATLAKHNLSMAQVEAVGNVMDNDPRIHHEAEVAIKEDWVRQVAAGIAQLFFCYHYRKTATQNPVFIGKSVNVMTATYMMEYVVESIKREGEKKAKEHYGEAKLNKLLDFDDFTVPEASKPAWQLAFCVAAAQKVRERCKELREAAERQQDTGVPGTALVLASIYKSEQEKNLLMLKEMGITLQMVPFAGGRNVTTARAAGTAYGNSINLSRQIGNNSSATKRLK